MSTPLTPFRTTPPRSALAEQPATPYQICGTIIFLLKQHFVDPDNIEEPSLRKHLWSPDGKGSLLISMLTDWRPKDAGKRPALLVRPPDLKVAPRGMGGHQTFANLDGELYRVAAVTGSISILCISVQPAEATLLSREVRRLLWGFGEQIRCELHISRFQSTGEVGPRKVKESPEHWACATVVDFGSHEYQTVRRIIPPIDRIDVVTDLADES